MPLTRRETAILVGGDLLILVASLWVALALRNFAVPTLGYFEHNAVPFIPVFLLSLGVFYIAGLYEKQTVAVRRVMGERIVGAQVANAVMAALLFFVLPLSIAPKTILALYFVASIVAVSLWRWYRAGRERATGALVPALLVASGSEADELYAEVNGNDRYLIEFTSRLDPASSHASDVAKGIRAALDAGAKVIVLDTRHPAVARDLPQLYRAMVGGITFLEFSNLYEDTFDRVPLAHIDHAWLLEYLPRRRALYDLAKRAFDILAAAVCLVIASPFILLAALCLRISGPAFIYNERVGQGGKRFRLVKLRTMLFDDKGDSELHAKNRVTGLGRFLRKTRIDELPQLWNVLAGEASFIGPRPELPAIAAVYEKEIPFYDARHLIQPGLSGFAQIRHADPPKGGADVEKTRGKLSYDLYYLKHRSFGLDLSIALKTLRELASFSGK